MCDNAKEMWGKFEVTHKGTNSVMKLNINLTLDYELFKIKKENVRSFHQHYQWIKGT